MVGGTGTGSVSSSSSDSGRFAAGMDPRDTNRRSNSRGLIKSSLDGSSSLPDATEEEEESWSSEYSASDEDEEEDQETFSEGTEVKLSLIVLTVLIFKFKPAVQLH